jgi:hypothetical protein
MCPYSAQKDPDQMPLDKAPRRKTGVRPNKGDAPQERATTRNRTAPRLSRRLLRVLVLALLLTIIAGPSLLPKYSVADNDLWCHLKTGDWIIEHHAFPYTGILSRTAADRPWMAYSWFAEVLLSYFHSRFHLVGVAVYGLLLTLAVSYSVFWMARRLSGSFWKACLLTVTSCIGFLFNVFPRPVFFSMLLFTVSLTLLLEARRTARPQLLYWLPPICLLWANTHIQFVYGVLLIGLFVLVSLALEWTVRLGIKSDLLPSPPAIPARILLVILAACLLASCLGPYSYHLYSVVFGYATAKFPYTFIREFQSLTFRSYRDFVQLLLTGAAFFALGRQKKLDPFLLILLVIASVIGFRTQRDAWFICIPAAACIAVASAGTDREGMQSTREAILEKAALAVVLALLVLLYAVAVDFNTPNLRQAIADKFPVQAINFIRDHPQRGPLYNTYDWGGFIAWYMPEQPVAIDGRTDLYGDDIDTRFIMTENGDPSYVDDGYLKESNLFLLPRQCVLERLLASDSRMNLIYQDPLAVVFVRRPDHAVESSASRP